MLIDKKSEWITKIRVLIKPAWYTAGVIEG